MTIRLVFLPREPGGQPWRLLADASGAVIARGPPERGDPGGAKTIVVVPGAEALAKWVELPTRSEAQARAAAAYLLEDTLAAPRERTHLALGPAEADGVRLAVAVDRERMRAWLAEAAAAGIKPDVLTPDHLLLPAPADDSALSVRIGESVAIRARRLALTCEADLAAFMVGERSVRAIDTEAEAERALIEGAGQAPLNLLQGEFAPRAEISWSWAGWRRPLALLAAAAAGPILLYGAQTIRYELAANAARAEAEAAARAALPAAAAAAADPVGLARQRLNELAAADAGGFLAPASALFAAIEATPAAQLDQLAYTPDGVLRARVSYANYADIDRLRSAADEAGFALEEGETANAGGRLVTEIVLRAQR